jgi:hypothetical protein
MTDDVKTEDAKKSAGRKGFGVNFKVSAKGAVSVYGLGRFPVTLYKEQWLRLLERSDDLKKFLEDHAGELAKKGEAPAAAEAAAASETSPSAETASAAATTPAPATSPERPAEQTAEGAAPATTIEDAGAGSDTYADTSDDLDTPPDDYDGMS